MKPLTTSQARALRAAAETTVFFGSREHPIACLESLVRRGMMESAGWRRHVPTGHTRATFTLTAAGREVAEAMREVQL